MSIAAPITTATPPALNPLRQLLWPNVARMLAVMPLWYLGMAVFLHLLSRMAIPNEREQFGLAGNLLACFGGGTLCFALWSASWFTLVRPAWLRSEAVRQRHEREGMYALLPWQAFLAIAIVTNLLGELLGLQAWIWVMDTTHSWAPEARAKATFEGSLAVTMFSSALITLVDVLRVRIEAHRRRAERAQLLQTEAQLQRLQAQMEPHMLFNTLANLHALIEGQPDKAQSMLAHLIDYLRATLSASRAGSLSLQDEMDRVRDYLALMQIRMGARLQVEIDVPAALGDARIPPMLIQPLVENAIKHGLDPLPQGGRLLVSARAHEGQLELRVQDDGQGLTPAQPPTPATQGGFGLDCIRARLHTSFGEQAWLHLSIGPGHVGTLATLSLPLAHTTV